MLQPIFTMQMHFTQKLVGEPAFYYIKIICTAKSAIKEMSRNGVQLRSCKATMVTYVLVGVQGPKGEHQLTKLITHPDTVGPRFNEPLFNKLLGITSNIFRSGKSYSKMYGTEPRFNELLDIFNEPILRAQT